MLRKLHRWVGLALALPLILQGLTGILLVVIPLVTSGRPQHHEPGVAQGVEKQIAAARLVAPAGTIPLHYDVPRWAGDSAMIGFGPEGEHHPHILVMVDPIEATVVGQTTRPAVLDFLHKLHTDLFLLPYGQTLMGIVGLLLFGMSLTGVMIWWPRPDLWASGKWRKTVMISPRARGLRLWRESHISIGFWTALFLCFMALTGSLMAFPFGRTLLGVRPGGAAMEAHQGAGGHRGRGEAARSGGVGMAGSSADGARGARAGVGGAGVDGARAGDAGAGDARIGGAGHQGATVEGGGVERARVDGTGRTGAGIEGERSQADQGPGAGGEHGMTPGMEAGTPASAESGGSSRAEHGADAASGAGVMQDHAPRPGEAGVDHALDRLHATMPTASLLGVQLGSKPRATQFQVVLAQYGINRPATMRFDSRADAMVMMRDPGTQAWGEWIFQWAHTLHEARLAAPGWFAPIWKALVFLSGSALAFFSISGAVMWVLRRRRPTNVVRKVAQKAPGVSETV